MSSSEHLLWIKILFGAVGNKLARATVKKINKISCLAFKSTPKSQRSHSGKLSKKDGKVRYRGFKVLTIDFKIL